MDDFEIGVSESIGQNNDEWDAERLGKFTASKFSAMMKRGRKKEDVFGDTCITYIYDKVAEILTMHPHASMGQSIDWGNEFEQEALLRYQKEEGVNVASVGFLSYNDYTGGSPDGLVGSDGIIEIKCPYNPSNHAKSLITKTFYNKDHEWQCQGNLMITDRNWCDFITYDPRVVEKPLQYSCFRVYRNDEMINAIKTRLKEVKKKLDELLKKLK